MPRKGVWTTSQFCALIEAYKSSILLFFPTCKNPTKSQPWKVSTTEEGRHAKAFVGWSFNVKMRIKFLSSCATDKPFLVLCMIEVIPCNVKYAIKYIGAPFIYMMFTMRSKRLIWSIISVWGYALYRCVYGSVSVAAACWLSDQKRPNFQGHNNA